MKLAFADPPYLGKSSKFYSAHPKAALWDKPETHQRLISQLVSDYPDGWALCLLSTHLQLMLPWCPPDVRIGAWVKPFCAFKKGVRPCYAWEPVIFRGGRNKGHPPPVKGGVQTTPKDYLSECVTLKKGLTGAKPAAFCHWVLDLLNTQPGDTVDDIFPGTGGMGRAVRQRLLGQLLHIRMLRVFGGVDV